MNQVTFLLPAFNEELTIGKVIDSAVTEGILAQNIIVGDNNSTDRTAEIALSKWAKVIPVPEQGKGHVVRELVRHVETPYAVLSDADDTYHIQGTLGRITDLLAHYGSVLTYRRPEHGSMSMLHRVGNNGLSLIASALFGYWIKDVVSGMWAFRRDVIREIEIGTGTFTPDADFVAGVLKLGIPVKQIPVRYYPRPDGSASKLKWTHGIAIAARLVERRFE
jgi:glycosyltransferase involved in cell wall biosynthesis